MFSIGKKRLIWITSILLICAIIFAAWNVFAYEESEKFNGFPIPKYAKVTKSQNDFEAYTRISTSETKKDGLPFIYRLQIKAHGWEKIFQEGALTTYKKDNHKIDVVAENGYLSIGINKE
ncbi:hypothetical protein [Siminovitchia sp. 179-K 8D1 HS]|uniref:hypothetical protein n=1 Tax=Siminovitchia sp. 179-K 8D1 HS TaxID=3142385 RepID=UPI0039A3D162